MRRLLLVAIALLAVAGLGLYLAARRTLASDLVRQTIEQQLAARLATSVKIGSATASIFPQVALDLHDVAIGAPSAVQFARVRLLTGTRALLSRRVEDAEIIIEDGQLAWPLPFSLAPAPAAATPAPSPFAVASVRRIVFRKVTIVTGLPPVTVDLDAALQGDRLEIAKLTAVSGATRLDADGAFDSLSRVEGRLHLKGDLVFAGYAARELTASVTMTPERLTLSPVAFSMFGGRYQGSLDADLRHSAPRLRLTGDVAGVDMAALLKNSGAPDGITGRLSGRVDLTAFGGDGATLLQTASGTVDGAVADGTLPNLDLVRPIVLAFGRPNGARPEGSGSAFSRLRGSFTLANGLIATNNLLMQSRDLDLEGRGSLRLDTGAVESRADAVLSRELTAQAGTDLVRYAQQDGRVIVPVTVSGTLGHPTVFVDVLAAGRRAAGNELKRRATDFLGGLFKKKKGGG